MRWLLFGTAFFVATAARADDVDAALSAYKTEQASTGAARETAQFELAKALYRLNLKQAAYGLFSEIADKPAHAKFSETLAWLAKLAVDLPAAADVTERVGKYDDAHIATFDNPAQRDLHAELEWLSGEYAYRNRSFDDAIARYARVDRSSPLYGKAQIMAGMASVQSRRSVPAVQAFQRTLDWLDSLDARAIAPDAARLRDFANLSIARTYFSAAIRIDDASGSVVDATRIATAAKHYRRVSPSGEFFLDAIFEDAWTRAWGGDNAHALGEARLVASRSAEAGLLEAMIQYGACRYDDASDALDRLRRTHEPRLRALGSELDALEKAGDDEKWKLAARSPEASDRKMAGYVAYDALLDADKRRFAALPAAFRTSGLGADVADAMALGQDIVRRNIADLGRERILRARDELDAVLRDGKKLAIDIVAARRSAQPVTPTPPPARPRPIALSWPINGTAARDPLYAAPIRRACP